MRERIAFLRKQLERASKRGLSAGFVPGQPTWRFRADWNWRALLESNQRPAA
jgi:hypothetical protein